MDFNELINRVNENDELTEKRIKEIRQENDRNRRRIGIETEVLKEEIRQGTEDVVQKMEMNRKHVSELISSGNIAEALEALKNLNQDTRIVLDKEAVLSKANKIEKEAEIE